MPRDLGSEPAFPTEWDGRHTVGYFRGMTKREAIAALILAGFAAHDGPLVPTADRIRALDAVHAADALLAALAAPKEE